MEEVERARIVVYDPRIGSCEDTLQSFDKVTKPFVHACLCLFTLFTLVCVCSFVHAVHARVCLFTHVCACSRSSRTCVFVHARVCLFTLFTHVCVCSRMCAPPLFTHVCVGLASCRGLRSCLASLWKSVRRSFGDVMDAAVSRVGLLCLTLRRRIRTTISRVVWLCGSVRFRSRIARPGNASRGQIRLLTRATGMILQRGLVPTS